MLNMNKTEPPVSYFSVISPRKAAGQGRVITPGLPICAGDEAWHSATGAPICAPGKGAPDKQTDTSIALMPARGTTLIKWGYLKLRQRSWGSDSLFFPDDITLLVALLFPFLGTNLPLAAAFL